MRARDASRSKPSSPLLTVDEAARFARVTPLTIRRWAHAGKVPATRLGRRLLLPKKALMALTKPAILRRPSVESVIAGVIDDSLGILADLAEL